MREIALGKINLGLSVGPVRPDGYHKVDMVMQTVSFADYLDFTAADSFQLTCDDPGLPCDEHNLAYKAAMLMSRATGHKPAVKIHIAKKIFRAAGLAGGSADGAAVLRGLNKFWQTGLMDRELEKLAAELGSDVPFCIRGGTVRATGRGEILEPLPEIPKFWLVLAKPRNLAVSTAWVYKNFNIKNVSKPTDEDSLVKAIRKGNRQEILQHMGNDLESVTLPAYPVLTNIKNIMEKAGAEKTMMSGSGPTIFGIAPDEAAAKKIAGLLQNTQSREIDIAVTTKGGIG